MHSGVAHGFRWPVMYRTVITQALSDSEAADGLVTNDEDQLMISAIAMGLLITRAFELYDLRRVPHV